MVPGPWYRLSVSREGLQGFLGEGVGQPTGACEAQGRC